MGPRHPLVGNQITLAVVPTGHEGIPNASQLEAIAGWLKEMDALRQAAWGLPSTGDGLTVAP